MNSTTKDLGISFFFVDFFDFPNVSQQFSSSLVHNIPSKVYQKGNFQRYTDQKYKITVV